MSESKTRAKKKDTISGVILAVLMLSAFGLVAHTIVDIASGPVPAKEGAIAPGFSTTTPAGSAISLADHKDHVVLVDFWATWCPPCVASMPILERVYREYRDKGVVVVGVDQEPGDEALVRGFLSSHDITFPIAMDPGSIARDYGVYTFPTSFLIGKDGVIRDVHHGVAVESDLRKEIEALLADNTAERRSGGAR
jgi:thiol-disulfide isomerase/thioredoxin